MLTAIAFNRDDRLPLVALEVTATSGVVLIGRRQRRADAAQRRGLDMLDLLGLNVFKSL